MKKKNNIFKAIVNGLKRAVKFVLDVLLFIPRVLIYGISAAVNKTFCRNTKHNQDDFCVPNKKSEETKESSSVAAKEEKTRPTTESKKDEVVNSSTTLKEKEETVFCEVKKEDIPKTSEVKNYKEYDVPGHPERVVRTPLDTDLPENFAVKTSERKKSEETKESSNVAAKEEKVAVANIAKEETKVVTTPEVVATQPVEKVEGEVIEAADTTKTDNPEVSNSDNAANDNTSTKPAFDNNEIGRHEIQALNLFNNARHAVNTIAQTIEPNKWMLAICDSARHLVMAWSDRVGYTPAFDESINLKSYEHNEFTPYHQRIEFLLNHNIISKEEAAVLTRRIERHLCMDWLNAGRESDLLANCIDRYMGCTYPWFNEMSMEPDGVQKYWKLIEETSVEFFADENTKKKLREAAKSQQQGDRNAA